jgi:hypothetical protein
MNRMEESALQKKNEKKVGGGGRRPRRRYRDLRRYNVDDNFIAEQYMRVVVQSVLDVSHIMESC